jgi:hypothetical protein
MFPVIWSDLFELFLSKGFKLTERLPEFVTE